jgi:regulator of protease activity HflC (stomatin/prohibitin superfamily)
MAVAHFIDIAGPDAPLRYLQVIFPVVLVLLGGEVFLNFVLNIYRPRKAGEIPRPAFDSRVLGFVAAPDRIADSISGALSYQLGFDVSASWFYQLLSRSLALLVLFGGLVIWLLTCVTMLQPHQTGRLLRFGDLVEGRDLQPGLHLKAPWPIDSVLVPEQEERDERGRLVRMQRTSTGIREIQLGTRSPEDGRGAILWTNEHSVNEEFFLVQSSAAGDRDARAGDLVLVAAEIPLRYVVSDVRLYEELGEPQERDELLRSVGQRVVMAYMSSLRLDEVLGRQRAAISQELRRRLEEAYAGLNPDERGVARGAGIEIVFVGVQGAHPPQRVAGAFERVVQAQQRRIAALENAQQQSIRILATAAGSIEDAERVAALLDQAAAASDGTPEGAARARALEQEAEDLLIEAGGSGASAILAARAERWQEHMGTRAAAELHNGQVAAYRASPLLFRTSLYFDSLLELMRDARVVIVGGDARNLWNILDMHGEQRATEIFTAPENTN